MTRQKPAAPLPPPEDPPVVEETPQAPAETESQPEQPAEISTQEETPVVAAPPPPPEDPRRPVALVRWGGSAVVELAGGDSALAERYPGEALLPLIAACDDATTLRMLSRQNLDTQAMRAVGVRLNQLEEL